jgi:NDP-sugar pyrophosphorylase family protein
MVTRSKIKAFVLAAGLGTRLRPLTDKTPKPMLKVGDKPLLEHQLLWLKKNGVAEILMNLFYFPEQIKGYFGNGEKLGLNIRYIEEKELSGTAGPIAQAKDFFDEPFFVIYGDNLTNRNLDEMKKFHQQKNGKVTISLYYEEHPESKGIVETDKNDLILNFKEKPKTEEITTHWANAGIYVCEPEIVDYIPNGFYDFGKDLFPKLIEEKVPMYGYKSEEYLLDIGTPETYAKAQKDILTMEF